MTPTRRPMRLPKITKYSVAVTTDGTMVWPQMRMMRPYSRLTMVWKPLLRHAVPGGVISDHGADVALQARGGGGRLAHVQHGGLDVQPAQQAAHASTLHDAPAADDGDVAAQGLGFLQIVRGENDGGAAVV